jgi:DNA (cytosine-5)-methyltransferase 1
MSDVATYGSLCTGYDGIGQGLVMAGLDLAHAFHAETESSVAEVLNREHPDVPNLGDIKDVSWRGIGHVDILSSGDPCQSISVAGRQLGRDDPRFLWPWVREAYRELQPDRIFLENVANIVSHDGGRTLAERLTHLREDGYSVRWTVLGACAVGAPHHRHRWFALAERVGVWASEAVRVGVKAFCGAPRGSGRTLFAPPKATDYNEPGVALLPTPAAREGEARGFPSRDHAARREADPMRSLNLEDAIALLPTPTVTNQYGNGYNSRGELLLPGIAAALLPTPTARDGAGRSEGSPGFWANRLSVRPDRAGKGVPLGAAINMLPTPRTTDGTNGGPGQRGSSGDLAMPSAVQPQHWGKYAEAVTLWEEITGVLAPEPAVPGPKGGVRLNPALPEWMMGLRPGLLTDRMRRNDALKAAGNGVVPHAAAAAWKLLTD